MRRHFRSMCGRGAEEEAAEYRTAENGVGADTESEDITKGMKFGGDRKLGGVMKTMMHISMTMITFLIRNTV